MTALPEQSTAPFPPASILNVVPAGVIWGFSFLCIKVAVDGMSPVTLAAIRVGLGLVVVAVAARARRARPPRTRAEWLLCARYAVVATVVPFLAFGWAEQRVASSLAGVLNGSTPLFTLLVGLVVEPATAHVGRRSVVGLLLGFAGVAVTAGVGGDDLSGGSVVAGALACVLAAACYGVGFVYARRRLGGLGTYTVTVGQLAVSTALLAPFGIGSAVVDGFALTPTRLLAVTVLGALGTGVAFLLNMRAIGLVGATRASLVTYIIPVVAVTVGVLVAGEPFTWRVVAGGVLVVAGVALSRPRPTRTAAA